MSINFNPSGLRKKSILRDTNGRIINWLDETDGGWIIKNRQVVNQERYDIELQKEKDKHTASSAIAEQVVASPENLALRTGIIRTDSPTADPSKVDELEKKVEGMESKLDAILSALAKPKRKKKNAEN
jgi:hypothetical protein